VEDLLLPASAASVVIDLVIQGVYRITTCQLVIKDVENVILKKCRNNERNLDTLINEFHNMQQLTKLIVLPDPTPELVRATHEKFIFEMRHKADIHVLAAAIGANPDVILSGNREHFNDLVAAACKIPIFSCVEFLQTVAASS
jgi:predicted nucleic acid-binding protein